MLKENKTIIVIIVSHIITIAILLNAMASHSQRLSNKVYYLSKDVAELQQTVEYGFSDNEKYHR